MQNKHLARDNFASCSYKWSNSRNLPRLLFSQTSTTSWYRTLQTNILMNFCTWTKPTMRDLISTHVKKWLSQKVSLLPWLCNRVGPCAPVHFSPLGWSVIRVFISAQWGGTWGSSRISSPYGEGQGTYPRGRTGTNKDYGNGKQKNQIFGTKALQFCSLYRSVFI